jgi:PHAX RNA-binding domain-containing protein
MDNEELSKDEIWAITKELSNTLNEKAAGARHQIANIVRYCGVEFVRTAVKDALEVEAQGGMMLPDNSRRRTLGGVFFYLARTRTESPLREQLFDRKHKKKKPQKPEEPESGPTYPPFVWEERLAIIESLRGEQGEISTVKVVLIGRPGRIERRQDLVITTVSHTSKLTSLPKGVPTPPSTPTVYTVYIGAKQWHKVEEAITNPEDALIIEGTVAFDPQLQAIAVYTTNVSTKLLDAKRREEQRAGTETQDQAVMGNAPKKPAGEKPAKKVGPQASVEPVQDMAPPAGMPPDEVQKLQGLYASATLFRQKIAAIQAKPLNQQSGMEMTQKLLKGVEDQITALRNKYS